MGMGKENKNKNNAIYFFITKYGLRCNSRPIYIENEAVYKSHIISKVKGYKVEWNLMKLLESLKSQ